MNRITDQIRLFLAAVLTSGAAIASATDYAEQIQPLLESYCITCHGPEKQKAEVRFNTLDPDMIKGKDAELWQLALDQLNLGEMPPKKKMQPKDTERRALVSWLTDSLGEAALVKRSKAGVVMRRLTKEQYANTLRDLLQTDVDFGKELPNEGLSVDGFKNNGTEQVVSLLQTEYFMQIADQAMRIAIPDDTPPVSHRYLYTFGKGINPKKANKVFKKTGLAEIPVSDEDHTVHTFERLYGDEQGWMENTDLRKRCYADLRGSKGKGAKRRYEIRRDGILLKPSIPHIERGSNQWQGPDPNLKLQIREFPTEGEFVLRLTVAKADATKADPYLKAFVGERLDHGHDFETFEPAVKVTGTTNDWQTIVFKGRLENFPIPVYDAQKKDKDTMLVLGVWNDCMTKNASEKTPSFIVQSMEFEAPSIKTWPPRSHGKIFVDAPDTTNEKAYSRVILQRFMTRAFRRQVTDAEVDPFHTYWAAVHPEHASFEASIRDTLATVLCSPHFLYLVESRTAKEPASVINEFELASRLSYFLWNTMPDDALLERARKQNLRTNLKAEFKRMIQDAKVSQFIDSFTSQWLQMEKMAEVKVHVDTFPQFNRFVRSDMSRETQHFFAEILKQNLSILHFIDADFTMLNQNLAQFYGIKDVHGGQFRKVALGKDSHRGGLLSHGLFLTGNSTGKEAHPIKRGTWLTSRVLDDPPPPPPPNVPQLDEGDPEFDKLSIKEQLKRHRDNPSCVDCHRGIDPWGLLFEQYNAIGMWSPRKGAATATLPNGTELAGDRALKDYLLEEQSDVFTRALVQHLLRYALGRSVSFADNPDIHAIVEQVKKDEYKLQNLLSAIITSPVFSRK